MDKKKVKLLDRMALMMGYSKSQSITQKRSINIAKSHRTNTVFDTLLTTLNADVYIDGLKLLHLVRDFEKNNPHVKKFLNLMVNNTVGSTGFNLYVKGADYKKDVVDGIVNYTEVLDIMGNKVVQESFWEWSKRKNCDITQSLSLTEMIENIVRQLYRDGEVLVIKHKGGKELNKFGFALQLVDVERLDTRYNSTNPSNKNRIVCSVELDRYNRKVAYWIKKQLSNAIPGQNLKDSDHNLYQRVAAEDCIYLFRPTEAEQLRGVSPMIAGLETLVQLKGYTEAELVNARARAGNVGFFISDSKEVNKLDIADEEDDDGNFITEREPGTYTVLPNGYKFEDSSPDYPETFDTFCKTILRTVASAFNVSYESLANDREGVNYSSIRAGLVEDREMYKSVQNFLIENLLDDIYEDWLPNALINKAIIFPNGQPLPFEKIDKFKKHIWRGRGFAWVDPLKDIAASVQAINSGLSSRQRECEKLGVDVYEIFDELEQERKLAETKGLHLDNSENVMAKVEQVLAITQNDESK